MSQVPQYSTLALCLDEQVLDICLNRPTSANALNAEMWVELQQAFEWADATPEVRVVILSGEGKHFCAGIDLSMFGDIHSDHKDPAVAAEHFIAHVRGLQRNLQSLQACRKPVLAAIHGACVGAGIDMVCYADMRYCDEGTSFCVKEIDIGIVADVGTLQNMPSLMPEGLVRELAYTGRKMFAAEAQRAGFVNEVYPDREAMMAGVRQIAKTIASKAPLAMRGTKQVITYTRDHSVEEGLEYVALWNAAMMSRVEVQESMTATLEKRAANFDD